MQKLKFQRVATKYNHLGPEGGLTLNGQPLFPSLRFPVKWLQPLRLVDGPAGSTRRGHRGGARTRGKPSRCPVVPQSTGVGEGSFMAVGSVLAAPIPQTPWHDQAGLPGARAHQDG